MPPRSSPNSYAQGAPEQRIRRSSLVELSLVVSICVGIAGGSVWATRISMGQDRLREDMAELNALVRLGVSDSWRGAHMRAWVNRANREVELWSIEAEHTLNLEDGSWRRFIFPDPDDVLGDNGNH